MSSPAQEVKHASSRKIGGKKKLKRSSRQKGKRASRRFRIFANIQRRRRVHKLRHPLDKEIEKAVRWKKVP